MYCGRHYLSRNAPSLLSQESGKAAWNLHPPRRYIPPGGQHQNPRIGNRGQQLLSWKVLKKNGSDLLATNAFALLTGKYFPFAKIQCALFKGTERDFFIDKKEYDGCLYEQIENAYQFVLRHINLGAEINGLVRKDTYELPVTAIREMIVNAVCHRNYMDNSCIQVAVYDDRIEVTSPGMLYGGLTLEEAVSGRSKIRNRIIADIFSRMEIIEEWGTGIRRILHRAKEYGLPEPEFMEIGDTFRGNLFKKADKKADKKPIKTGKKADKIFLRQRLILDYIEENGFITNKEAREILGLADSTTKRFLKYMVETNLLLEKGQRKSRKYIRKSVFFLKAYFSHFSLFFPKSYTSSPSLPLQALPRGPGPARQIVSAPVLPFLFPPKSDVSGELFCWMDLPSSL